MKNRKQKKPNGSMRPSRKKMWDRAARTFQLTEVEVVMAKATGFAPLIMYEVASGRRSKKRSCRDKLPMNATKDQIAKVKEELRRRYAEAFGDTDPMKTPWGAKLQKTKQEDLARLAAKPLKIPAAWRKRIENHCSKHGLKPADEIQAALEAYFPPDASLPEEPAATVAVPAPPPAMQSLAGS